MLAYTYNEPVLYHDGTAKADELRQALVDEGQHYREIYTENPGSAVVIQDGNCYFCPESVRRQLIPRINGYRR